MAYKLLYNALLRAIRLEAYNSGVDIAPLLDSLHFPVSEITTIIIKEQERP